MSSKKWPKNKQETVMFSELVESVRKALEFAYDLKRKNRDKTIPWTGYDIGNDSKVCCHSPHEALQKEHLDYDEEDQGRDALDIILGIAIQMGIEQGRRMEREKIGSNISMAKIYLDALQDRIWDIAKRCGERK